MKYLCLIYHAANTLEALPESAYDALIDDSVAYDEELLRRGQYIGSSAIQLKQIATTIRVREAGYRSATVASSWPESSSVGST